jgi:hypothetical protein
VCGGWRTAIEELNRKEQVKLYSLKRASRGKGNSRGTLPKQEKLKKKKRGTNKLALPNSLKCVTGDRDWRSKLTNPVKHLR